MINLNILSIALGYYERGRDNTVNVGIVTALMDDCINTTTSY